MNSAVSAHALLAPADHLPDLELVPPSHPGLFRAMSRPGLLMAACARLLPSGAMNSIRENPLRTALYCACDTVTAEHDEILANRVPPKWGLQTTPGLAASSVSILLGIEGGVHSFSHSEAACFHALDQAQMDLAANLVDFAVVAAAVSKVDPIINARYGRPLQDGAGLLLLSRGAEEIVLMDGPEEFGIAAPLIGYLQVLKHAP